MEKEIEPVSPSERAANMARSGATNEEIATVVGLSRRALRKLGKHLDLERAKRRFELRKKQTELALEGNEQMLRVLGEIELEQAKKDRVRVGNRLPDLERYPETGYPAGDPRTLLMRENQRVQGEELLRFGRFVAAYAKENPGKTWVECLRGVGEICGVELPAEGWEGTMGQVKLEIRSSNDESNLKLE